MAITYTDALAVFDDVVSVEEAEGLLQWLQDHAGGSADLSACTHLHAADLQVLMASAVSVHAWPRDATLRSWLSCALAPTTES